MYQTHQAVRCTMIAPMKWLLAVLFFFGSCVVQVPKAEARADALPTKISILNNPPEFWFVIHFVLGGNSIFIENKRIFNLTSEINLIAPVRDQIRKPASVSVNILCYRFGQNNFNWYGLFGGATSMGP